MYICPQAIQQCELVAKTELESVGDNVTAFRRRVNCVFLGVHLEGN
jgi:hypothetical protein